MVKAHCVVQLSFYSDTVKVVFYGHLVAFVVTHNGDEFAIK